MTQERLFSRLMESSPVFLTAVALTCHLIVGWMDQRRVAIRIVGPLSPMVGWLWVIALGATALAVAATRKVTRTLVVCGTMALVGVGAIWWW